ncbi:MAG: T9SS type A sorting domain-containing protein [Ignavibacteriales bacterium]|nr:T9SS type A sorting domain-containing protein [Ignavibacteriales bacterium]
MKRQFILLLFGIILFSIRNYSQIPNAGFESWLNGNPEGWSTNNAAPSYFPITQSNQSHGGASSAQGSIIDVQGFGVPVVLSAGTDGGGFPISTNPAALHGWYQFTGVGGDILLITTVYTKNGNGIGGGQFLGNVNTTTYSEFVANTTWINPGEIPDTAFITIQILNTTTFFPHAGSTFIVDDLVYGNATSVESENIPAVFQLKQNYPNPFNPSTKINYEIPATGFVSLKVYDMLGKEVATLVNEEKLAGDYEIEFAPQGLLSGIYFYKLKAGNFVETRKMILLK